MPRPLNELNAIVGRTLRPERHKVANAARFDTGQFDFRLL
jgi:hypothetical protein